MVRSTNNSEIIWWVIVLSVLVAGTVMGSIEEDEKDCADQMSNMAACIPFVSGGASKPTAECCENTKKVKNAKPKCLCVLIVESTDPSMGLPINTTLALQMPSACNINDANPSNCPSLLNLAPDSSEAKIFKGSADTSTASSTTKAPPASSSDSSTSPSSSSSSSSDSDTKTTTSTNAGANLAQVSLGAMMVLVGIGCGF